MSQAAWQPVFRTLGMRPWFGELLHVSRAGKLFDPAGKLTDEDTRERLGSYLKGFVDFVGKG